MPAVNDASLSARNRSRIRDILLREWDPIRVRNIPGAPEEEYDRYIEDIRALLADPQRSKERIAAYLLDIQSRKMLLHVTPAAVERCNRAADSLMAVGQEP
jgi:hypothetical protein